MDVGLLLNQQHPSHTTTMDLSQDTATVPQGLLARRPSFLPFFPPDVPNNTPGPEVEPETPQAASTTTTTTITYERKYEYWPGEFEGRLSPGHYEWLEQRDVEREEEKKKVLEEIRREMNPLNIPSAYNNNDNVGIKEEEEDGEEMPEPNVRIRMPRGAGFRKFKKGDNGAGYRFNNYDNHVKEEEEYEDGDDAKTIRVRASSKENRRPGFHATHSRTTSTASTTSTFQPTQPTQPPPPPPPPPPFKFPPDTPVASPFKDGGLSSAYSVGGMKFATVPRELIPGEMGTDVEDFGRAFFVNLVQGYGGKDTYLKEDEWVGMFDGRSGRYSAGSEGRKRGRVEEEEDEEE